MRAADEKLIINKLGPNNVIKCSSEKSMRAADEKPIINKLGAYAYAGAGGQGSTL